MLFQSFASSISDPRQETKVLYPLDGILLSSLCGVVSGCGSFVDVALYGEEKSGFLRNLARIIHQPNPISSGREGLAVLTGMT